MICLIWYNYRKCISYQRDWMISWKNLEECTSSVRKSHGLAKRLSVKVAAVEAAIRREEDRQIIASQNAEYEVLDMGPGQDVGNATSGIFSGCVAEGFSSLVDHACPAIWSRFFCWELALDILNVDSIEAWKCGHCNLSPTFASLQA